MRRSKASSSLNPRISSLLALAPALLIQTSIEFSLSLACITRRAASPCLLKSANATACTGDNDILTLKHSVFLQGNVSRETLRSALYCMIACSRLYPYATLLVQPSQWGLSSFSREDAPCWAQTKGVPW